MSWPVLQLQKLALQEKGAIVSGPFGSNIGSRFFVDEGVPVIRGNNLTKGDKKFIDDGFVYLTEQKAAEFPNCIAISDDIVFTAAGSIGQVGIIPDDTAFEKYVISNKQMRVRLDQNKANPLFVYYWLSSKRMIRYLIGMNNGGAVPLLNLGIIRRVPIPCPDIEVQDKVALILQTYDDLIENNHRRIQLLEESARFLYKEWFVNLRYPGHEHVKIIEGVPEGWSLKPLTDVAVVNEKSLKKGFDGEVEYVDIATVSPNSINETTWYEFSDAPGRARRVLKHKDVIWSCVRPNRRSHAFVWMPHDRLIASTGFAVISSKNISPCYLYQYLTTNDYVGYLTNNAGGAAYPAVTAKVFEKSEVLVPDEKLQIEFEEFVEIIFQEKQLLSDQVKKLAEARDILLPRLMSGELAV